MTNPQSSVCLRAMEPEDLELLYRIENDPDSWGVSTTNVPYSRYVLHDFVARSSGDIYTDKQVRLIIELEDGTPIGLADLMNFDPRNLRAEVGIIIAKHYRRRGYASKALEKMVDYARQVIHLHQLYAFIALFNEASLALFAKQGFVSSEQLADWLYDGQSYQPAVIVQKIL